MRISPSKNCIVDIQNVYSRYPKCGYLKLKAQHTRMAKVTSFDWEELNYRYLK